MTSPRRHTTKTDLKIFLKKLIEPIQIVAVRKQHQQPNKILDYFTRTSWNGSQQSCLQDNSVWHMLSGVCCIKHAHL